MPHPFSIVTTAIQLFSDHRSSSQFLQFFHQVQNCSSLPMLRYNLFTYPCSSQLFSMTLTFTHLAFTLLNWPQLFSPLATSSTCPTFLTSAQPISLLCLSSPQMFSPSQPWPTFLNSSPCYRDASSTQKKFLHRTAFTQQTFTHSRLVHRKNTQKTFTQRNFLGKTHFCTEKPFPKTSICKEKLLHKTNSYTETLLHRKILQKANFCTDKFLHTANFCTEKLLHAANFYTEQFYTQKLLRTNKFPRRNFYAQQHFT